MLGRILYALPVNITYGPIYCQMYFYSDISFLNFYFHRVLFNSCFLINTLFLVMVQLSGLWILRVGISFRLTLSCLLYFNLVNTNTLKSSIINFDCISTIFSSFPILIFIGQPWFPTPNQRRVKCGMWLCGVGMPAGVWSWQLTSDHVTSP